MGEDSKLHGILFNLSSILIRPKQKWNKAKYACCSVLYAGFDTTEGCIAYESIRCPYWSANSNNPRHCLLT